jgi:hypothetical protein
MARLAKSSMERLCREKCGLREETQRCEDVKFVMEISEMKSETKLKSELVKQKSGQESKIFSSLKGDMSIYEAWS